MPKNIDLGETSEGGEMKAYPIHGMVDEKKKYYPSFHYSGSKKIELDDEGEMTIKFKKVSSSVSENEEGDTRYSCTIEVREIVEADYGEDTDMPKYAGKDTEDALDTLAAALGKKE